MLRHARPLFLLAALAFSSAAAWAESPSHPADQNYAPTLLTIDAPAITASVADNATAPFLIDIGNTVYGFALMPNDGGDGCDGYGNHDCDPVPPAVALDPIDCSWPSCEWGGINEPPTRTAIGRQRPYLRT